MTLSIYINQTPWALLWIQQKMFCCAVWDTVNLSDVCFKFIQPFSCCSEGDKGLLFPSLVLTLCWFGMRRRELFKGVCRRPTGWSSSLCLFNIPAPLVCVYPQPHLFVCLCDQLQVGVLILPWKMLRGWQHLSASDSCVAVDLGFLGSYKTQQDTGASSTSYWCKTHLWFRRKETFLLGVKILHDKHPWHTIKKKKWHRKDICTVHQFYHDW